MSKSCRAYVGIWTPPANDEILAILLEVRNGENSYHFEADIIADRLDVQTVSASTREELEAILKARYGAEGQDKKHSAIPVPRALRNA